MPNVNVTYEEMRGAGRSLRAGQGEINDKLNQLRSLISSLVAGGYVTDASSKQFDTSYEEFNKGALQMMEGLDGMAGYLDAAAQTFEEADTKLAQALNG
jgi:WXG100 family type VII secretion target